MRQRRLRIIVFTFLFLIALWFICFFVDSARVANEKDPVFCIETSKDHFTGFGYSFDIYPHPINGKNEYIEWIFDIEVKNTLTN